jgi:hypothetical protein
MKDTITEFFFFSEEDLRDFHYDTHKFGGLRFFLELAVFLAVKLDIDNPKNGISFFRMCRKFLVKIERLQAYDGYKYPASIMINFLLFVRLCRFKTREYWSEFLERHKGWAMALGFNNGAPHESDVTKFVNFNEDGFELECNVKNSLSGFINFIPKWVTNSSGSILKAIK